MINGNVKQTQFPQNSLIAKANKENVTKKNTFKDQNDDFKKVLANKEEEQQKLKDSKVHTKKEVKETKGLQEDDKEKKQDKPLEETELSELNILIENLIQTLQSSNMIDGEKLESLIKEIENIIASLDIDGIDMDLDKLSDLLVNLKLINSSELINNEELKGKIEDKLDELSQLMKSNDSAFGETNLKADDVEISNSNSNLENPNSNLENQDMANNSNGEKELDNKEKPYFEGQEKNVSMEENSKKEFQILSKKNLSTDPNALNNNDMDMAAIRNLEVDNSKNLQSSEISKTLTNSNAKPDLNIFNQILDGTKLSISEDVSEMFLKLKPDNLGNLSMKISIERGMMVARFDVESQMVKEAIESNLEDLRNALSDKGFEIKEFSVSVNKDSDNQESSFSYFSKKKSKKQGIGSNQLKNDTYASNQQTIDSINSSINYLA